MDATSPGSSAQLMMVIGGAFILIGLIFIPIAIKKVRADLASQDWPQAVAVLKHVEVVKHVRERPREEHRGLSVSYAAVLDYEYTVGGKTFKAQHGEGADNAEQAAQRAAAHTLGETRDIHYQPDAPENFRVEMPSAYTGLLWLLPFAGFAGFGWLIIKVGG